MCLTALLSCSVAFRRDTSGEQGCGAPGGEKGARARKTVTDKLTEQSVAGYPQELAMETAQYEIISLMSLLWDVSLSTRLISTFVLQTLILEKPVHFVLFAFAVHNKTKLTNIMQ